MSTYTAKVVDFDITIQNDHQSVKAEMPNSGSSDTAQETITPLQDSLYKLSAYLSDISRNQKYIRTRENRNFETVESTEGRMFWFAVLESMLIVGMAVLQVLL